MGSKLIQPRKRGSRGNDLTPNQRLFVEYLMADEGFNPTRAARAAGYKQPKLAGQKNLRNPAIAAMIGKVLQERINGCKLTAKDVLNHLATALFMDPMDLFESTGRGTFIVKDLQEIPPEVRRCISKLKCRTRSTDDGVETYVEIELMSKDSALTNAMKHLGLVSIDPQVNVNVGGDVILKLLQDAEQQRTVIDTKFIESNED